MIKVDTNMHVNSHGPPKMYLDTVRHKLII